MTRRLLGGQQAGHPKDSGGGEEPDCGSTGSDILSKTSAHTMSAKCPFSHEGAGKISDLINSAVPVLAHLQAVL